MWFTSMRGVSRLVPRPDPPVSPPPPVWVTSVRVAGVPHAISELGQAEVTDLILAPGRNQLGIDYGSLSYQVGGEIRYQHRVGGNADWSKPTTLRSIGFVDMSPGKYRFEVRAVDSSGAISERPATVVFRVMPPLWRRWWFILLAGMGAAAAAVALHRARVARAVAMERLRTRIATDLHDDIGASLSQIAILSEVLHLRTDLDAETSRTYLSRIAESSRTLVDSMSDVVWAINPKRDRLRNLIHRMRRFFGDAVMGKNITTSFRVPSSGGDLRLDPDLRRHVYLVFKESVNNAIRHAECRHLKAELGVAGDRLTYELQDDGRGFDRTVKSGGHGIDSMKRRARELGGELRLESRPGHGTRIRLQVPMGRRRQARRSGLSPE
jgi:signal transduction histidine kinase